MAKEDVSLREAMKVASYITISVLTPLIFLYLGSERGILPFDFTLPITIPTGIVALFVTFDLCFAYSVLDQWTE